MTVAYDGVILPERGITTIAFGGILISPAKGRLLSPVSGNTTPKHQNQSKNNKHPKVRVIPTAVSQFSVYLI